MGMDYTVYLVPAPPAVDYRPDADTAARLVAELGRLGWVDLDVDSCVLATAKGRERRQEKTTQISRLASDLNAALAAYASVMLELTPVVQERHWPTGAIDSEGRSRMYEFREVARLEARYCDSLWLVWPAELCTPDGENVGCLPCSTCGADLCGPADVILDGKAVPSTCGSCGSAVAPDRLVGETHDVITGELRREPAPVFRFAIACTAAHNAWPEREPVEVDGRLLAMLFAVTGVKWRALASLA